MATLFLQNNCSKWLNRFGINSKKNCTCFGTKCYLGEYTGAVNFYQNNGNAGTMSIKLLN